MKIFDITRPISHGMPVYEGDPAVAVERWLSIRDGAPANVSRLVLGSHTGTHVDAPAHFREGATGVDRLPLDVLMGPARVYPVPADSGIDRDTLRGLDLVSRPRILFKTGRPGNRDEWGSWPEFPGITRDAARLLVHSGVKLIGIDSPSVEPFTSKSFPTHETLLDAGVILLEGLDLSAVPPGEYELVCLPMKIVQGDGAPARVVLREISE
jgi:arylformamidase